MVSEAVHLRRPVVSVSPARFVPTPDEASYRKHILDKGWMASLEMANLSPERFSAAVGVVQPAREDFAVALARLLVEKIPDLVRFGANA